MAKKIKANRIKPRTIAAPKKLVRSYWLMKPTGETQHCRWTGRLQQGAPPVEDIAKLIGVRPGYVERTFVMYGGKRYSMFMDENGKLRKEPELNWKASAIYANIALINNDLEVAVYNDLLEDPAVHPAALVLHGLAVIGTAMLWEGEFGDEAGSEDALPSIMELCVKL
jgi:hypothetical protein